MQDLLYLIAKYFVLPPLQITIMGLSISLALWGIRNKKYARSIFGGILTVIEVILFLQSDFIRSRRVVDTEWMIGKTIEQVRERYYYPEDDFDFYTERTICEKKYILCNAELYRWTDGSDKYINYYVLTDTNGRITDIFITVDKLNGKYPDNHHYLSRWYINTY